MNSGSIGGKPPPSQIGLDLGSTSNPSTFSLEYVSADDIKYIRSANETFIEQALDNIDPRIEFNLIGDHKDLIARLYELSEPFTSYDKSTEKLSSDHIRLSSLSADESKIRSSISLIVKQLCLMKSANKSSDLLDKMELLDEKQTKVCRSIVKAVSNLTESNSKNRILLDRLHLSYDLGLSGVLTSARGALSTLSAFSKPDDVIAYLPKYKLKTQAALKKISDNKQAIMSKLSKTEKDEFNTALGMIFSEDPQQPAPLSINSAQVILADSDRRIGLIKQAESGKFSSKLMVNSLSKAEFLKLEALQADDNISKHDVPRGKEKEACAFLKRITDRYKNDPRPDKTFVLFLTLEEEAIFSLLTTSKLL